MNSPIGLLCINQSFVILVRIVFINILLTHLLRDKNIRADVDDDNGQKNKTKNDQLSPAIVLLQLMKNRMA